MAKSTQNKINRRAKEDQLPDVLAIGLVALRIAGHFNGWEPVAVEVGRRKRRHPAFNAGKGADTWIAIVEGRRELKYAHLELLEGVTGVPTGVILAVTGSMALLRTGTNKDDAVKYAEGLRALADDIQGEAQRGVALNEREQEVVMTGFYAKWRAHGFDASMPTLPAKVTKK